MQKGKLIFYLGLLTALAASFAFRAQIVSYFQPKLDIFEKNTLDLVVQEVKKQVSVPPPLRAKTPAGAAVPSGSSGAQLTVAGTIQWTNTERKVNGGLAALAENSQLDTVAKLRMNDMFKYQYFAHVSPASSSAITVAGDVEYHYIALGENLALGNFGSDEKLVEAWMGSPGHRENILNPAYREIGVAVGKGVFEGDITWLAVQVFGKPASACPSVDPALKAQIDASQAQLKDMQQTLAALKSEIDSAPRGTANDKIRKYNAVAEQYNALLGATKPMIDEYNAAASAFNACIGQ